MQKGQIFIPFHYDYFDSPDGRARAANELTQERWDPVSKQPIFESGPIRVSKVLNEPNGEVKIHVHEQHSDIVKKVEMAGADFADVAGIQKEEKLERMLEYWLRAMYTSLHTLQDICDHIIPRILGVDYEVSGGMQVMLNITQSCVAKLDPIARKYEVDTKLGHELSETLKGRFFPDVIVDVTDGPFCDVLIVLQSFHLFLGHIEAQTFALEPTAQACWDEEFAEAVDFISARVEKMKQWNKQQLHSRGPQTLIVPCKQAVGLRERVEKRAEHGERKMY